MTEDDDQPKEADAGTWLTLYETKPASWLEWRESLKRKKGLTKTAAPYPPECILYRAQTCALRVVQHRHLVSVT